MNLSPNERRKQVTIDDVSMNELCAQWMKSIYVVNTLAARYGVKWYDMLNIVLDRDNEPYIFRAF